MQRRKAQFADLLQIKITGEIVVGSLGAREFAQRRQAHAVVETVRRRSSPSSATIRDVKSMDGIICGGEAPR